VNRDKTITMAQEQGQQPDTQILSVAEQQQPEQQPEPEANPRRAAAAAVDADIQNQLDVVMSIIDENQDKITDGEYLRAMNALGSLHKHKRTAFGARRPGSLLRGWMTHDDICEDDELYEEVMDLADSIVVELCGEGSSIYMDEDHNMVSRGEEYDVFELVMNYMPEEGNAGYESSPLILHHALQMIMLRIFRDTHHELEIVRPVSCQCGWRGAQGNWDRHIRNARHQRWVASEENRKAAIRAATASLEASSSSSAADTDTDTESESDVVYIDEEHCTPESQMRRAETIAAAKAAGKRIVFVTASGTMPSPNRDVASMTFSATN